MRTTRLPALLLTVAVGVSACSSGGSHQSTGTTRPAGPSPSSTSTSPAPSAPAANATCTPAVTSKGGAPSGGDVTPPGDIPDDVAFVPFTPASARYTVRVPEGWARTDGPGDTVTFTDKLNTIRVELVPATAAPTVQSATAADLPAIRSGATCFEGGKVTTVSRRAGPTVLITYRADSSPDPVTGKVVHDDVERYELWKAGTAAVLTLSGPQGSDNVDAWKLVTDSFQWR